MTTPENRIDWWAGFSLGFPLAYPAPPFYLIGFAVFCAVVVGRAIGGVRVPLDRLVAVLSLVAVALASSLVGSTSNDLDLSRILTTSFFFGFLLFGSYVRDSRSLLDGLTHATVLIAIAVLLAAVLLRVDRMGVLLFTVPDRRLWGAPYFPDWPNFLAFLLSMGALLEVLAFGRLGRAALTFSAALLTTSRTPLIALLIAGTVIVWRSLRSSSARIVVALGFVALLTTAIARLAGFAGHGLMERLFVLQDRQAIWEFAGRLIRDSPLLGHGAVLLDASVGFSGQPSFHNSYLDIAVRHGLLGLALFLLLLLPSRQQWRIQGVPVPALFALFIIGSWFQNFLKHPHLMLLFSGMLGPRVTSADESDL